MSAFSVQDTLERLKRSPFRSKFHLNSKDRQLITNKGTVLIHSHAMDFITNRIASSFPKNDGKQTPFHGHPVFVAQHATATCCRGCIARWYRIPKGRVLTQPEINTLLSVIEEWLSREMLITR
jgi:hypothetical protein